MEHNKSLILPCSALAAGIIWNMLCMTGVIGQGKWTISLIIVLPLLLPPLIMKKVSLTSSGGMLPSLCVGWLVTVISAITFGA